MPIIHVATNNRLDRDTKELGEAWPAIRDAEAAYQAFRDAFERVQKCASQSADYAASEILAALADARHDACWDRVVGDAREAFDEARVVEVRRS